MAKRISSVSKRQIIKMSVLPGQPLDGTGRICIHLFVQDEHGLFIEPCALHPKMDESGNPVSGKGVAKPTRGRLACDPKRNVAVVVKGDVTTITPRTDDARAVSCLKCKASIDYERAMKLLEK